MTGILINLFWINKVHLVYGVSDFELISKLKFYAIEFLNAFSWENW